LSIMIGMSSAAQHYKHAPLVLVVIELRHPEAEPPEIDSLRQAVREAFPVPRSREIVRAIAPATDPSQPMVAQRVRVDSFFSRDSRSAITVMPDRLALETTDYPGWEEFRSSMDVMVRARLAAGRIEGIERLGLRYVDEIRVPDPAPDWSEWVQASLVAPSVRVDDCEIRPEFQQCALAYRLHKPGESLVLRYGAAHGASAFGVAGEGGVERPNPPTPGPFFLLDSDAFWERRPGTAIMDSKEQTIMEEAEVLHGAVSHLFETFITARLREEVLNAD